MTSVTAKRRLIKFYFGVAFAFLFFMAVGILLPYIFMVIKNKGTLAIENYLLIIFSPVSFYLAVNTVTTYFRNVPIVTADKEKILFSKETFYWKDLEKIEMTGKQPFRWLFFTSMMEGARITFRNQPVQYFFDDFYQHPSVFKSFIQSVIIDKKEPGEFSIHEVNADVLRLETFEAFKGNQLTSLRGIYFWGFLVFLVLIFLLVITLPSTGHLWDLLFIGLIGLFWGILNFRYFNYFELSNKYLRVRNHIFFWKKMVYALEDVSEVAIEKPLRAPLSLRVYTKDFKSRLFFAATLRTVKWEDLKNKFEGKGIIFKSTAKR
ncbi:MAG TPA: hypothetical protein PLR06_02050 [Cyclobacteriaceae bacterium]|nr:hypothetical protein [Cyclobacteriaceae bacterium]